MGPPGTIRTTETLRKEVIFLHLQKLQYVSIALYGLYIIQSSEAELITWGFKIYSRELTTKVFKDSTGIV